MNIKVENNEEAFRPVVITLTATTQDEVDALFGVFRTSPVLDAAESVGLDFRKVYKNLDTYAHEKSSMAKHRIFAERLRKRIGERT